MSGTTDIPNLEIVNMSPEARDYYKNDYLLRLKELQKRVSETILVILVWGPGQAGGDFYKKRVQIRNELRSLGHVALFSEEIDMAQPAPDFSAKMREMLQAKEADLIVCLQASPGSTAEVHDFAGIQDIGSKMLIFIDEQAQEGYSYTGLLRDLKTLYDNVETYKYPRDIKDCRLIQVVQNKVKVLQCAKWVRDNLRRQI